MATAKPERLFCASCGFPLRGQRCEICGGDPAPIQLAEGEARDPRALLEEGSTQGLERAIEAHRNREHARFVGHVVTAEGVGVRTVTLPEGPGWIAAIRGALVFASINTTLAELTLQAPVVRVPRAQRMPVLRLALELSARELATARFCLRDDLLVLRFGAPLASLTPVVLRDLLREMGHLAARWAELFAVTFDANPATDEAARASAGFEIVGRPRKLRLGSGMMRSIPPPAPSAPEQSTAGSRAETSRTTPIRASSRNSSVPREEGERISQNGPPPLPGFGSFGSKPQQAGPPSRPTQSMAAAAPPRAEMPEPVFELAASSMRSRPPSEPIPAILAPMFAAGPGQPRKSSPPIIPPLPPPPSGFTASKGRPVSMPEIEIEAPSRRPGVAAPSISGDPRDPADRLCSLLRQAKTLASLVLEMRPGTMPWLVRATVFRAIHDYRDVLPEACAHLYRCTGMGRDAPEPALLVLDRVVASRAHHPGEKPLAIDPLASATQAKEHVARYLAEIERSPLDPGLRHYLTIGALSELLARARLPQQTEVRLRDIVSHAQREGAKQGSIDLMMTALQRIAGG
ncbi:MAG: YbjN domain-containing protein [Byssovorax sp.]